MFVLLKTYLGKDRIVTANQMSAQLTDEEALNRVASYCSTAEHCRAEINEKLQRWGNCL